MHVVGLIQTHAIHTDSDGLLNVLGRMFNLAGIVFPVEHAYLVSRLYIPIDSWLSKRDNAVVGESHVSNPCQPILFEHRVW